MKPDFSTEGLDRVRSLFFGSILCIVLLCCSAESGSLLIGTAINRQVLTDTSYQRLVTGFSNIVTPAYDLKFKHIQKIRGVFDFTHADKVVAYARDNHMAIRGHTLIWHGALPDWVVALPVHADTMRRVMFEHIEGVVSHYRGNVYCWDVVNEAFDTEGNLNVKNPYFRAMGKSYIEYAFRIADQFDSETKLFYNDYGPYGITKKSDAVYATICELLDKGVRIDGIGFQMHLRIDENREMEKFTDIARNFKRFAMLGLEIHITEADVSISKPVTPEKRKLQIRAYQEMMRLFLSIPACKAFVTWGLTDKYAWFPESRKNYAEPSLFDSLYKPKPVYDSVMSVIEQFKKPPVIENMSIRGKQIAFIMRTLLYESGYAIHMAEREKGISVSDVVWSDTILIEAPRNGVYEVCIWPIAYTGSFLGVPVTYTVQVKEGN